MHILLVNDDGINATGIRALCEACVQRGHKVSVCAPHTERSASSHRITLADPIFVREVDFSLPNVRAWSISGTPADCVRIGLYELVEEPVDVVISGINNGHNAGMAVHYSGTVAAAREGALNNLPSIATSLSFKGPESMLHYLADFTVQAAEVYVECRGRRTGCSQHQRAFRGTRSHAAPDGRAAVHRRIPRPLHPPRKPARGNLFLAVERRRGGAFRQRHGRRAAQSRAYYLHKPGQPMRQRNILAGRAAFAASAECLSKLPSSAAAAAGV